MSFPINNNQYEALNNLSEFVQKAKGNPSKFSFFVGRRVTVGGKTMSLSAIIKETELLYSKVGPTLANNRNLVKNIVDCVRILNGMANGRVDDSGRVMRFFVNISQKFSNLFYDMEKHMTILDGKLKPLIVPICVSPGTEMFLLDEDTEQEADPEELKSNVCERNEVLEEVKKNGTDYAQNEGSRSLRKLLVSVYMCPNDFLTILNLIVTEGVKKYYDREKLFDFLKSINIFGLIVDSAFGNVCESEDSHRDVQLSEKDRMLETLLAPFVDNKALFVAMILSIIKVVERLGLRSTLPGWQALGIASKLVDIGKALPAGVGKDELISDVMGQCFCRDLVVDLGNAFSTLSGEVKKNEKKSEKEAMAFSIVKEIVRVSEDSKKQKGLNHTPSEKLEFKINIAEVGESDDSIDSEDVFLFLVCLKDCGFKDHLKVGWFADDVFMETEDQKIVATKKSNIEIDILIDLYRKGSSDRTLIFKKYREQGLIQSE